MIKLNISRYLSKTFLSFYVIISLLAIAVLAGLTWEYSTRFSPPINFENKTEQVAQNIPRHVKLPPWWGRQLASGNLKKVTFKANFQPEKDKPLIYSLRYKPCFVHIKLNGHQLRNLNFSIKNKKCDVNNFTINLNKYKRHLKAGNNVLEIMTVLPKKRKATARAASLPHKNDYWLTYAIAGTLLLWASCMFIYYLTKEIFWISIFNRKLSGASIAVMMLIIASLGLLLRMYQLPIVSHDMGAVLLKWYGIFQTQGMRALSGVFYDYPPMYVYLLGLMEWAFPSLPPVHAIKFISIAFDFIAATLVFKLVYTHSKQNAWLSLTAYSAFMCSPMVYVNSSMWGQCDVLLATGVLFSIYYFANHRPLAAVFSWSIAMCIKLQAIFFAPIIVIMWLKERFHWSYLLIPFALYILSIFPAVLQGSYVDGVLMKHVYHADKYKHLALAVSNPYMFISNGHYDIVLPLGIALTLTLIAFVAIINLKYEKDWDAIGILLLSTLILTMAPYFLPKMLDRYFYMAAICSIPLAALYWRAIPLMICLNLGGLCYPFHFIPNPLDLTARERQVAGMILNSLALFQLACIWGYRLYKQHSHSSSGIDYTR